MLSASIDIWWFCLDPDADRSPDAEALLDQEEWVRYRRFDCPAAAKFFAFRRAARRVILSRYVSEAPANLRFAEDGNGKPSMVFPEGALQFSASDTGRTGLIAVASDTPVGVDVERLRPIASAPLAERILSPRERLASQSMTPSRRASLALRAWTGKEALVKGMGIGLDLAVFRQISLALDGPPGAWKAARLGAPLAKRGSWHVCEVPLESGPFPAAILSVAARSPRPFRVFDATSMLRRHGLP